MRFVASCSVVIAFLNRTCHLGGVTEPLMRVVLCDKQANDHTGGHSVSGYGNVVPECRQLCDGTCRGELLNDQRS